VVADPIVGLLIAGVAIKDEREAWSGEGCACSSDALAGLGAGDCEDNCRGSDSK
jgi:hypothetical protein